MKTTSDADQSNIVTLSAAAKVLGYARQTLNNYVKEDGCPTVEPGTGKRAGTIHVDTVQVVRWLLAKAKGGDESPLFQARLEKTQQEQRKIQIANDEKMGKLVSLDAVKAVFSEAQVSLRNELDAAASRIAKGDAETRKELLNECRVIQSNYVARFEEYIQGNLAPDQTS